MIFEKVKKISCGGASFGCAGSDPALLTLDTSEYVLLPGFCDVHVHFREPGFSYKETMESGSRAAARGGYTAVCAMPNLEPVPDCPENLSAELAAIRRGAVIDVRPYGAITRGERGAELADLEGMAVSVIGFSDDGKGVQSEDLMREAMEKARSLGRIIAAHCEDERVQRGGCIHEGAYAAAHGYVGISSESEWRQVERDLRLAAETGCAYHVCHVSTKESVALIRDAKRAGVDVSCETAPHYLLLDEGDLREDGRFKMAPPLRSRADREAVLEGVCDGTIDMIATDHAPHSAAEKSRGLTGSAFGIVGLETAFPLLYTGLVLPGILSLERLTELLCHAPRARFGLPLGNDFSLWDLEEEYTVEPDEFLSMGRATPFAGQRVRGRCLLTVHDGEIVYRRRPETDGKR